MTEEFELDRIEDAKVQEYEENVETTININDLLSGRVGSLFNVYVENQLSPNARAISRKLLEGRKLDQGQIEEVYSNVIPDLQKVIKESDQMKEQLTRSEPGRRDILSMVGAASEEFGRIAMGSKSTKDLAENITKQFEILALTNPDEFEKVRDGLDIIEKREEDRKTMKNELINLCDEYDIPVGEITTALQLEDVMRAMIDQKKGYKPEEVRKKLEDIGADEEYLEEFDKLSKKDFRDNAVINDLMGLADRTKRSVVYASLDEREDEYDVIKTKLPRRPNGVPWYRFDKWQREETQESLRNKTVRTNIINKKLKKLSVASEEYRVQVANRNNQLHQFGQELYASIVGNDILQDVISPGETKDQVREHASILDVRNMLLSESDEEDMQYDWYDYKVENGISGADDFDGLDDDKKEEHRNEFLRQQKEKKTKGKKKSFLVKVVEVLLDSQLDAKKGTLI